MKNSENDFDAYKRDGQARTDKIKKCYTENDQDGSDNEEKLKRNKEIIDKHFKESSKLNSVNNKDIKNSARLSKLRQLALTSPILKIKVNKR